MMEPLIPDYGRPRNEGRKRVGFILGTVSLFFFGLFIAMVFWLPFAVWEGPAVQVLSLLGPMTSITGLVLSRARSVTSWIGAVVWIPLAVLCWCVMMMGAAQGFN